MSSPEVEDLLRRHAPDDVRETVAWLRDSGYALRSHHGSGPFGAELVYAGATEVRITVDRSQWFLDVAPGPGATAWQYDLLVAARSGRPYDEVFPEAGRPRTDAMPEQLPVGVSWRETLPGVLAWMAGADVGTAVGVARRQRARATG